MTPARARAPRGQRVEVVEPFQRGSHVSVISALGLQGVGASMMIEGAIDAPVFDAYVDHFLGNYSLDSHGALPNHDFLATPSRQNLYG